MKMIRGSKTKKVWAMFLCIVLMVGMSGIVSAQRRYRRDRRHGHSKLKGALIGGTAGLIGGALIGGRKGALIGAGAGAGTGYLIQRHRNRRHRLYYRRH